MKSFNISTSSCKDIAVDHSQLLALILSKFILCLMVLLQRLSFDNSPYYRFFHTWFPFIARTYLSQQYLCLVSRLYIVVEQCSSKLYRAKYLANTFNVIYDKYKRRVNVLNSLPIELLISAAINTDSFRFDLFIYLLP